MKKKLNQFYKPLFLVNIRNLRTELQQLFYLSFKSEEILLYKNSLAIFLTSHLMKLQLFHIQIKEILFQMVRFHVNVIIIFTLKVKLYQMPYIQNN